MSEQREFPVPLATNQDIAAFIARYGKPYDPVTDDYHREPFVADIREGKNDPVYNAHSYHTKVPPRAIIPYILHYTEPGDIVLDPFCGSGMTGVGAMMCNSPPNDILESMPLAKKGYRKAVLSDLSPAACHIAYNCCTPVDVSALEHEFERIKRVVKQEFEWLYGTEHYEPAIGLYDPANPEVARRLKNPTNMSADSQVDLISPEERCWELLSRTEVERRIGTRALARTPLSAGVNYFVCIPAMTQYTIWSDVFRCQGMLTITEPTGKTSTRGRNTGKPIIRKKQLPRGCGAQIVLWDAIVDSKTGKLSDLIVCPHCAQHWKKLQITRIYDKPVETVYTYSPLSNAQGRTRLRRVQRPLTLSEEARISEIENRSIPYWYPDDQIDMGREMLQHGLQKRGTMRVSDFFFKRQLWALGRLWKEFAACDSRLSNSFRFLFTSLHGRFSKRTKWHGSRFGQCAMPNNLYVPSLMVENNVLDLCINKFSDIKVSYASIKRPPEAVLIRNGCATEMGMIPESSVDYIYSDPPFGQNIYYADCSLLWEGWLQRYTDEEKEIVVSERRDGASFKTLTEYQESMKRAFLQMLRVLKPNRWATIVFNNSSGEVFEAIKTSVRDAGFHIENMVFLDKVHKTFKQLKGEKGEEDVVGHDVIFNLRKPPLSALPVLASESSSNGKLEHLVADTIREHLRGLPSRIETDPGIYSDDHRSTRFLNTMLMNSILKDVNVERINLPFIDEVCSRYFKKIDNRWFLPEEVVQRNGGANLYEMEVLIQDETTATQWLHEYLDKTPMRIGELRPHWMKATVRLTNDLSTKLERLLRENFWLDRQTRRWRQPTDAERAQMNNVEQQRAIHDAERFVAGTIRPAPADLEILDWIGHLYGAASFIEQEAVGLSDTGEQPELPAEAAKLYGMMPRLLQAVLKENVDAAVYAMAQRQCRIAAHKVEEQANQKEHKEAKKRQPTLFD